jgi:hypothetical protein
VVPDVRVYETELEVSLFQSSNVQVPVLITFCFFHGIVTLDMFLLLYIMFPIFRVTVQEGSCSVHVWGGRGAVQWEQTTWITTKVKMVTVTHKQQLLLVMQLNRES